ncbi:MAG TPA: 4-aminobutyrate--2-oxoglutarate transaminase, partial [Pseudonocardiaceae bacterium]|nr:4-aminobutyrate--2-oxoglutarate transaminase [Pseudonocardiaceae bacterium]
VARRIAEQADRFTHTCFIVSEYSGYAEVSAALNRLTPGEFEKRSALFSTGAEAVENAVKIARAHTGRPAVVVLGHAYHGRTLLALSMTANTMPYKQGFGPFAPEIYRVPSPYPYRWPGGPARCAEEAVAQLREIVRTQIGARNVAAIVVEPIQGEGGFVVPPESYLPAVRDFATENGIVFVADEIQTGFARTGDMFACEHENVVPDLVTTAKALGAGLPLAGVTGRAEIMNAVDPGGLGGTYAGNPIACAAALASIEVIERDKLVQRAREIEARVKPRLAELVTADSPIGDVRGRGAMLAMEFVRPGTTTPAPEIARAVSARCHAEGVLTLMCGTFGNVIRLLPPLVIDDALLDDGVSVLNDAVAAVR